MISFIGGGRGRLFGNWIELNWFGLGRNWDWNVQSGRPFWLLYPFFFFLGGVRWNFSCVM